MASKKITPGVSTAKAPLRAIEEREGRREGKGEVEKRWVEVKEREGR